MDTAAQLQRGRRSFRRQAWDDAHGSLTAADGAEPLGGADLELLATSAFMLGREDEYLRVLERAYGAHAAGDAPLAATRCAFWVGAHRAQRGDMGQAGGWLARARRMLERAGPDHVERGYLLLPVVFAQRAAGDWEAAAATAGEAVALAERFGDQDLLALAAHEQGHTLVDNGRLDEGLALLDEAMVAAAAGELSPIVAGIVYCGAILACQDAYELGRAQEWTVALTRWWDRQPALVAFTGRCLVHRAEILQLHGDWPAAMEEAARAVERCQGGGNAAGAGEAWYRQGEIHRLRGELAAAERAYREAHGRGRDPEPGRALLRLAQGRRAAATGAIRRALGDLSGTARIGVLCAAVEVFVATGETAEARAACDELEEICGVQGTPALDAMRARARGTVALAEGEAAAALATLRRGRELWLELGAPYEAARVRSLAGVACRALGDEEGAALEIAAAEETFRRLAADPDIGLADPLRRGPAGDGELTERQLEVLRLVADGATNREIAARLVISEHTVARHLQNVFARLGVSSRTGAIARARDHDLL